MFSWFKIFVDLTTPQYLLIALISPLSAFLLINGSFPSFALVPIIFSLGFAILGFNALNQASDVKIDRVDKPHRPIVSNKITVKKVLLIAVLFYMVSLIIAAFTNLFFLSLLFVFIFTNLIYCNLATKIKNFFWGSSMVGMILYGAIPFLSAYSISTNSLPIPFFIFFILMAGIYSNVKDFEDTVGEQKFNINSLPLMLGVEKAAILIQFSMLILLLVIGFSALVGIINSKYLLAAIISIAFLAGSHNLFWKELLNVKHKNIVFKELNNNEMKNLTTQSGAVTLSTTLGLIIQLVFGFFALLA